MTYQEEISALIKSVEKTKRKARPRYRKSEAIRDLEKVYHDHKLKTSPLPLYAVPRTTFEDHSANGLTKAIISYIQLSGGQAYRINSQGQYDVKLKRWRHSGMRKGLPDVQAVVNGQYLGIEIKIGHDRQSEHQKKIQSEIEASGGIYFLGKDFQSFKTWFDNLFIIN